MKLIAAGGDHSLAGIFSPLAQYPVDVTKDLLLIYNTNSADSATVLNYYLAHRPMVGGANVLGIGCSTNEYVSRTDFTNQILTPYLGWMAANPTKRPGYIVIFLDVPSRVNQSGVPYPSVQYQLSLDTPARKAFLTSIKMNGTNDCLAYIDKLANMGSKYSPGQVLLSASGGGYGNTNYVVDSIRHGPTNLDSYPAYQATVSIATNGLLASGVSPSAILYADGLETITNEVVYNLRHLTNAENVAGYISWGAHSSLGRDYALPTGTNRVQWSGNSGWWLIETIESHNGDRFVPDMGHFLQWFSPNAFGEQLCNYTCWRSNTRGGADGGRNGNRLGLFRLMGWWQDFCHLRMEFANNAVLSSRW